MKRTDFLKTLRSEKKLSLVEPSEEISMSYAQKSESNLISARLLLEHGRLEESVSLSYYSMYNILTALLFRTGIKCENHSGAIILLELVFGIDNNSISHAKKERVDKQYYVDFTVTAEDAVLMVKDAEKFRAVLIDFISKINNETIKKYRAKFTQVIIDENRET